MATFEKTTDLVPFMKAKGLSTAVIKRNPATGKRFVLTDTDLSMRVAEKVTEVTADLAVSWFAPEDGEPSWLLHTKGDSPLETLSSFSI